MSVRTHPNLTWTGNDFHQIPTKFTGIHVDPSPTKFQVDSNQSNQILGGTIPTSLRSKSSYKSHDHEISDKYKIMAGKRIEP